MRIVLTGGGTGGHIIPFEPIIESLRALHVERFRQLPRRLEPASLDITFLGIVDEPTRLFFAQLDVPSYHISAGKLRRYPSAITLLDLVFRLPYGLLTALWRLWSIMPDVVVSKGGFGSIPTVLAAGVYRIPIILHDSDAVSGLANRVMARLATTIAVGFAETRKFFKAYDRKTVITGTPVRLRLRATDQARAKEHFGFSPTDTVLLVMGGSLGAAQINEVLLQILPTLVTLTGIIHVTGSDHLTAVSTVAQEMLSQSPQQRRYKPFAYLTDTLAEAYSAADVVVCRAGATTLAELALLGKASLLVPLPTAANDEQRYNAAIFEAAGAARVLDASNVTKALFLHNIRELLEQPELRARLAANCARLARPRAGRDIAELAMNLAQGLVPTYAAATT